MMPKTPTKGKAKGRGRGRSRIPTLKVAPRAKTPLSGAAGAAPAETDESRDESNAATTSSNAVGSQMNRGQAGKLAGFSRAAHSIMTLHKLKSTSPSTESVAPPTRPAEKKDPWASVMGSVVRKVSRQNGGEAGLGLGVSGAAGAASDKRISLAQMLKSREMKNLVQQALVAKRGTDVPEEQSSVMAHWIKLSTLRKKQHDPDEDGAAGGSSGGRAESRNNNYSYEEEDDSDIVEDLNGVHSGFDLDDSAKGHQLYS
jgi:hypothetical protein